MLYQDLQPLLALCFPEILCWLRYKPLSDQNHQTDWNLSSSQDANLRPISFSTITISRASSSSSSSSSLKKQKKRNKNKKVKTTMMTRADVPARTLRHAILAH
jgi:hypothetical protein